MNQKLRAARRERPGPESIWVEIGILAVLLLFAWQFIRLRYQFNIELPLATLSDLAAGHAYRPFQFRVLAPWLAKWLMGMGWGNLVFCYQTIEFGAVIGIYYSFRYFLSAYFESGNARLLAFIVFYALPWNYLLAQEIPIILPYDLPAVMFFTFGLALLQREKWRWFYPVFVIGCLNRETMIFLTIALFAVKFESLRKGATLWHLGAQTTIWAVVKLAIGYAYRANPGTAFEYYHAGTQVSHLSTNLQLLTHPVSLLLVLSNFGFAWVIMLVGRRQIASPFLRRVLWIIPPFLLTLLVGTNLNENRLYGELIPIVMSVTLLVAIRYLRAPGTVPLAAGVPRR